MPENINRIRMVGPDGSIALIPESRIDDAIKMGARVEPKKEAGAISSLAKGFLSGAVGSIPDTVSSIYNIPASIYNARNEANKSNPDEYDIDFNTGMPIPKSQEGKRSSLPIIPSVTEKIEKGIENVIGETPEPYKHMGEGAKLAGSLAGPGGIAKVAGKLGSTAIPKVLEYVGSLKPSTLSGGAVAGTAMSHLNEEGYSPLTQIATGIGIGSIPSIVQMVPEATKKTTTGILGLSPKKLNLKAAQAAKESGVELPASAFTDSKVMGLIDQYLGKTPYFGDKLRNKYLKSEKQTLERLNSIYDDVGPLKTEQIENKIGKLYKESVNLLPENASVTPNNTLNNINSILEKLKKSLSPSEDQSYVIKKLTEIKEGITKHSTNIPLNLSKEEKKWLKKNGFDDISKLGKLNNEYPVENLWETKKSLNDTINWNVKDNSYKDLLRNVQHGILEDIGEYGKKDPVWYNAFKSADELFGKVAKRKRLEHLLSERPINPATGNYSYNSLSKIIHAPQTSRELKDLTSPDTFSKIEKLGEVARAMSIKSSNIPNPSGTAMVAGVGAFIGGLYTAPFSTTIGAIGLGGVTKLLTDQKFLDLAIKTAEGAKNSKNLLHLRKKVKELTGVSINTINRRMNAQEQKENNRLSKNDINKTYYEHSPNIKMKGPDGIIAFIPQNKIQDAIKMGASIVD